MTNNKILKTLKHPSLILFKLNNKGVIKLSDKQYLKARYLKKFDKKLDLKSPKTYNEKLQWLKLYDRKDIYTTMVDKYSAKQYVKDIIGEEYIIPTIGIYDNFDDIDFDKLPNKFVIKCTHDSGGLVICNDKKTLDIEKTKEKINKSLKTDYYLNGREWPYKNVKRKIIIEKNMGADLSDYKFMCFNGKVKCTFVCTERNSATGLKTTFFDREWKKLPFKRHYEVSNKEIAKPKNYDKMLELAEKLSENIPFLRVDFYEIKGKIYFGELTFFPGSGYKKFEPNEWDMKLGNWLKLPEVKNEK